MGVCIFALNHAASTFPPIKVDKALHQECPTPVLSGLFAASFTPASTFLTQTVG